MTKEEKIKEAWGDEYSNDVIMEGSRCGFKIIDNLEYIVKYQGGDWHYEPYTFETVAFIPKGLRGYLKNNGWIKIESEDDLPKKGTNCHFILKNGVCGVFVDIGDSEYLTLRNRGTHYKPIEKPKPPLF